VSNWFVYLLRCSDNTFYAGVATDIERRVKQHNGELAGGARYTRGRRPVSVVWQQDCDSRSEALKREAAIKKLSRTQKLNLVRNG
jgi:putative endonuclease